MFDSTKSLGIFKTFGVIVYACDSRIYVDFYEPITHSYETLRGVYEALYYAEKIDFDFDTFISKCRIPEGIMIDKNDTDRHKIMKVKELLEDMFGENEPTDEDLDYNDRAIQMYADMHNLYESICDYGI